MQEPVVFAVEARSNVNHLVRGYAVPPGRCWLIVWNVFTAPNEPEAPRKVKSASRLILRLRAAGGEQKRDAGRGGGVAVGSVPVMVGDAVAVAGGVGVSLGVAVGVSLAVGVGVSVGVTVSVACSWAWKAAEFWLASAGTAPAARTASTPRKHAFILIFMTGSRGSCVRSFSPAGQEKSPATVAICRTSSGCGVNPSRYYCPMSPPVAADNAIVLTRFPTVVVDRDTSNQTTVASGRPLTERGSEWIGG